MEVRTRRSPADAARSPIARRFVTSLSFQILGTATASFAIPLVWLIVATGRFPSELPQTWNSAFGSLIAALGALTVFRGVTAFPGTRGFAYILPSFAVAYSLVATALLMTRAAFSGFILSVGMVAAMAFAFVATHFAQRFARRHFYVVPAGNTGIIADAPGVDWIVMSSPDVRIDDPHAAIVADLRHDHVPEWERMLANAAISGRPVYHTKQLRESLTGRVQIEHLSENSFGSLLPNLAYRKAKRAADIVAVLIALPILAIPFLIIAVAIKLDSPGVAFFRQERMGYRGLPFRVIKFRTMQAAVDTVSDGDDHARLKVMTRSGDERVTRLGRFLRRSRIDELPQFVNVLIGEMSLIGPRPEAVELSQWYERELPFYRYRHIVRPGITGWAQINQGHVAELEDVLTKLHYDFYYIKHFSAWMDALITMRTIAIMVTGFGSK